MTDNEDSSNDCQIRLTYTCDNVTPNTMKVSGILCLRHI